MPSTSRLESPREAGYLASLGHVPIWTYQQCRGRASPDWLSQSHMPIPAARTLGRGKPSANQGSGKNHQRFSLRPSTTQPPSLSFIPHFLSTLIFRPILPGTTSSFLFPKRSHRCRWNIPWPDRWGSTNWQEITWQLRRLPWKLLLRGWTRKKI